MMQPLPPVEDERLHRLTAVIAERSGMIIAYSGGADSALLAVVASEVLPDTTLAVTAVSPSLAQSEREQARMFAKEYGLRHLEVCTDEADREAYIRNDASRCFHCKSSLFEALEPIASLLRVPVALGTNTDDLGEHRPGLAAAREHAAIAPLVEADLTKRDVRELSAALGLRTAAKPAQPCLASRVAYGDPVTPDLLARIDRAEQILRAMGFAIMRVRSHAHGSVARVEVAAADLPRVIDERLTIDAALRECGFTFCSVDLAAFSSGRLNDMLSISVMPSARSG
jgi:uncharacterized protein